METAISNSGALVVVDRDTRTNHKCLLKRAIEVVGIDDDFNRHNVLADAKISAFQTNSMTIRA